MFGEDPTKKDPNDQTEERVESFSFTSRVNDKESDQSRNQHQVETITNPTTFSSSLLLLWKEKQRMELLY